MSNSNELPAHPNQWYTPAYVRVYRIEDDFRLAEEHFSDIQMAWIWIKNEVGENLQEPNFLKSFAHTVERLAASHADGQRGYVCAEKDGLEYCVFYRIAHLEDRSRFSVQ
jgi:hypothetical protein